MKMPLLRSVLRRLVIAGLPLLQAAPALPLNGCSCPDPVERTIWWKGTRADIQNLIDGCAASGGSASNWTESCAQLCETIATMYEGYQTAPASCELVADSDGTPGVRYTLPVECVGGRRPAGLSSDVARRATLGDWFARMARLEAASIHAFAGLHRELLAHGAPRPLAAAAHAAIAEEAHHTFLCGALARRFGGTPAVPEIATPPERELEDVAVENAVEGCVRETWGAQLAAWQASAARDPQVAQALRLIAADETRHAAFSWRLHDWAATRLGSRARRRVNDALRAAATDLARAARDDAAEAVAIVA